MLRGLEGVTPQKKMAYPSKWGRNNWSVESVSVVFLDFTLDAMGQEKVHSTHTTLEE